MGPDLTGKLFRFIIRQLGPEVRSGKVVLGAETHAMRSALTEVTGVEFTYLPHPVEAEKSRIQEPRSESIKATVKPLVFGCYGAARWEKGSDVLQAAIRLVLQEKPEIPVNFVFQWLEDFKDEHGLCVSLDPWMREHPKVEVVERYFNEGEIHLRLAQTDVMVLPYRKPYRLRVSRVVIEAMLNGMPVIATEDTTLLEQVNEHGCGLACQEGSAESLARAILQAAANSDLMQRVAKEKAPEVQSNFSVDRFRQLLMNQTTKRQRQ
jgi:glycosyltransferase involved in cell wall biosynthesis